VEKELGKSEGGNFGDFSVTCTVHLLMEDVDISFESRSEVAEGEEDEESFGEDETIEGKLETRLFLGRY
jgi:hypothetical protein